MLTVGKVPFKDALPQELAVRHLGRTGKQVQKWASGVLLIPALG